jgi:hypothetical protein
MSKRDKARELESLYRSRREHEYKRKRAQEDEDHNLMNWYDKEIAEMDRHISQLETEINSGEDECPHCGWRGVPVSNRCRRCDTYMG